MLIHFTIKKEKNQVFLGILYYFLEICKGWLGLSLGTRCREGSIADNPNHPVAHPKEN